MLLIVKDRWDSCRVGSEYLLSRPTTVVDVQDWGLIRYIEVVWVVPSMSIKQTSQPLNIGATIDLVDGTPANLLVTLPLSSLDREVFVVTDIQMDSEPLPMPTAAGNQTSIDASVNKTSTSVLKINSPNCVGSLKRRIIESALPTGGAIYQDSYSPSEASTGTMADYLTVIATPNFVIAGSYGTTAGGASNRAVFVRVTGYRAVANADTYAALVTEELNQ